MVEKLVKWLLGRVEAETAQKTYVKEMYVLAELLNDTYSEFDNGSSLEHMMYIISFNTRYKDVDGLTDTPHNVLIEYLEKAKKGNLSFIKEPLYQMMKAMQDKQAVKLRIILNRVRK